MKKIVTMIAVMAMCLAASAQVAFWSTRVYSHWNEETQQYEQKLDTFSGVDYLFRYDQVDSFRVGNGRYSDEGLSLYYYLNNNAWGYMPFKTSGSYNYGTNGTYEYSVTLDSLAWQPYAVKGIGGSDSITLPLRTVQQHETPNGAYYIELNGAVEPKPRYAFVKDYSINMEDTSICGVHNVNYYYTYERVGAGVYGGYGMQFTLYPYAVGRTKLNVNINGLEKQVAVIITPKEEIEDVTYGLDSLFNAIYGRMTETGNCKPAGCSDLPDVDEGNSSLTRVLSALNDMSADQVYWVWNDPGIGTVRNNTWEVDNQLFYIAFQRLYYNIYLCNSFLNRADAVDAVRSAEVRFIRAYMYYQLMDLFGNVPVVTNNTDFFTASQATRAELYDFVESELLAAEQSMMAQRTDLYRLDKKAAWLLLSRVYLNSEVYAGKQDFTKAAEYAYKVLQSDYTLCPNYQYLFMGDNDNNGAQNEAVWLLRQVGSERSTWGGSMYNVGAYADGQIDVGATAWTCANTRRRLINLFPSEAYDARNNFMTSSAWYDNKTGKTILKWTGAHSDGQAGTSTEFPDTDIPLFRVAEAYLNYAEAVLRGGSELGGLTALQAVNAVRERAGAEDLTSIELNTILDERGREFYAECMRRPDLVRFNKYGGETGYQWQYKGGATNGKNFSAHMNIYPIPQAILEKNPALVQNAGY